MSVTRAEEFNNLLLIYSLVTFFSVFNFLGNYEMWALRILAIFVTLAHIHYGVCVVSNFFFYKNLKVRQLCSHFKINAFSLKYLQRSE